MSVEPGRAITGDSVQKSTGISAMATSLYVFPDTNFFLQCKPMEQLDWTLLGDWETIEVIVTRPVQGELDAFKGKGNSRQASKARAAVSRIAKLLEAPDNRVSIRSQPAVHLSMRIQLRPDSALAEELDYGTADGRLVGTAAGFQRTQPGSAVKLLSYDTGPLFSAQAVGLEFVQIPGPWLMPPEPDDADKRASALQTELSRYQKSEPSFEIAIDQLLDGCQAITLTTYSSLSDDEVESLMSRLAERFPEANDFGSAEAQEEPRGVEPLPYGSLGRAIRGQFRPATPEEVASYRDSYANWKAKCAKDLANLHKDLNRRIPWPTLAARITNAGSRPADNALVEIEAQGDCWVVRPPSKDDADDTSVLSRSEQGLALTRPPVAPKGRWTTGSISDSVKRLQEFMNGPGMSYGSTALDRIPSPIFARHLHDPNAFYWKEGNAGFPAKRLSLTCDQWRHAQGAEGFSQVIMCPISTGEHSGRILFKVQAANLTNPASAHQPVLFNVEQRSCLAEATRLIDEL